MVNTIPEKFCQINFLVWINTTDLIRCQQNNSLYLTTK